MRHLAAVLLLTACASVPPRDAKPLDLRGGWTFGYDQEPPPGPASPGNPCYGGERTMAIAQTGSDLHARLNWSQAQGGMPRPPSETYADLSGAVDGERVRLEGDYVHILGVGPSAVADAKHQPFRCDLEYVPTTEHLVGECNEQKFWAARIPAASSQRSTLMCPPLP